MVNFRDLFSAVETFFLSVSYYEVSLLSMNNDEPNISSIEFIQYMVSSWFKEQMFYHLNQVQFYRNYTNYPSVT